MKRWLRRLLRPSGRHLLLLPPGGPEPSRAQALSDCQLQRLWRQRVEENQIRRGLKPAPTVYRPPAHIPAFIQKSSPSYFGRQAE